MKMSLAFDRSLNPTVRQLDAPPSQEEESRLHVAVIFTSFGATVPALEKAGSLAESLGARMTLLVRFFNPASAVSRNRRK